MTLALRPIDPLATAPHGRYEDQIVVVTRQPGPTGRGSIRTAHFTVWHECGRVHLRHALPAGRIDNDLTGLLIDELFTPGWVCGREVFERLVTGIVLTSAGTPLEAWTRFYRNSLLALSPTATRLRAAPSGLAPVHQHALDLVPPGSVLELGSCFGFLSLWLAMRGQEATASDLSTGTSELLAKVAPEMGVCLDTLTCDAALVPRPDKSFDTVVAVHLLEHLEPRHGAAVLAEARRLARRRVVVAVPFEDEPNTAYGHVRTFTEADLAILGRRSGWHWHVHEYHGGWLLLDRP